MVGPIATGYASAPGASPSDRRRPFGVAVALLLGIAGLLAGSALIGGNWLPPAGVFGILLHQITLGALGSPCGGAAPSSGVCTVWTEVVWGARMPTI